MATEIVRWCDVHMSRDEHVTGNEVTLSLGGKLRALDLCPGCEDEHVKPLRALLDEFGHAVDTAPASPRKRASAAATGSPTPLPGLPANTTLYRCLWCPEAMTTAYGMLSHAERSHGLPSRRVGDVFGTVCPVCGEGAPKLGIHAMHAHPEFGSNLSDAFLWARDNGDPHGAYAAVFARGTA